MKIVIAGASGFVGSHLITALAADHEIKALSRRARPSTGNVEWVQCDLFSQLDLEKALAGADVAIYLIHSMLPSARLTQGSFRDFDMILADNFSRACVASKIKKIIYLSGIIPPDALLSEHLQSRLEVENILKASGIPISCLRAGLIIGPGGSSFEMMLRLVRRLPMMVCPYWTSTLSYPISIWDVVEIVKHRIANYAGEGDETLDLCGPDALSYEEMMRHLSRILKKNHFFLHVPFVSPTLSRLWVRLITGAPRDLVYPLVDSLKTHMIPLVQKAPELSFIQPMGFDAALERSLKEMPTGQKPNAFSYTGDKQDSNVRSVQRMTTLFRSDVATVAKSYFLWLAQILRPVVRLGVSGEVYTLSLRFFGTPLLIMERSVERSSPERQLFYIRGGLLARSSVRARLEFRDIYHGLYKIIAIHDYRPRLPWFFYKYTQALVHLWVMRAFGAYLIREKL
jgi:uncharacterized protein YbjT (DUF2867 family)